MRVLRPDTSAPSRRGLTMVELMISVGITSLVLGGLMQVSQTSSKAFQASVGPIELETRARRAMARVIEELAEVSVLTMEDDDPATVQGVNRVRFRHVTGVDANGDLTTGPWTRLSWMRDPFELDDGLDNDGDGLIDEGRLILVRDEGEATQKQVVLCRGVSELLEGELGNAGDDNGNQMIDESGFALRRENSLVSIWLTVEGLDPDGNIQRRSVATSVRLRNGL